MAHFILLKYSPYLISSLILTSIGLKNPSSVLPITNGKPHLTSLYLIRIRVLQNYRNKLNKSCFASIQVLQLKNGLNERIKYSEFKLFVLSEITLKFVFYFVFPKFSYLFIINFRLEFVEQHS
jgi:hypothetical protein